MTQRANVELELADVRVVEHARENAHVVDTRGEDNLSLPAEEPVLGYPDEGNDENQDVLQVELQTAEER
eukprot:CAMPEP_0202703836 /NCGR_PEP_ID=MMETSP1385-20130828/16636_1 /ASSEMBLY_ACC=CAM_ASM_000861 /TAXON_ID=933848 /ORGANISM="Elphidium margaritaceum" /LENGTH=68 /DNA_ID=CAMNT_0049361749 /DNA_START=21 /DNA_END=223 /DNA_ORIENTATION=-